MLLEEAFKTTGMTCNINLMGVATKGGGLYSHVRIKCNQMYSYSTIDIKFPYTNSNWIYKHNTRITTIMRITVCHKFSIKLS